MSPLDISSSPNQRWLAKEFASSLDQTHRSTRHDVHGYVEFAKHLGETEGPEPDPEFCAALRHRLLHELIEDELLPHDELALRREDRTRRKGGSHCFERSPREPWIAAASTVLVVCGGAFGLGQESSQAMPTDSLYPVKRFFEGGEMAIAGTPGDQARELMEQAAERLDEARTLVTTREVHAQEALPATISDFSEATTDAGVIVLDEGQTGSSESATLVSEFRSFSAAAHVVLDEVADGADPQTAALIADARSTLDGIDQQIEQQLPILDPVMDIAEDTPVASDALSMLGLNSQNGNGVHQPPTDEASSTSVTDDGNSVSSGGISDTVEQVTEPLDNATSTLQSSVSVVELAANDTVSMAVATVNNTVKSVDHTVSKTLDTAKQTLDRTVKTVNKTVNDTVAAVDQTVKQTTAAVDKTVKDTVAAVDHTLNQATDSLQQTTDALQQTTDGLQTALGAPQPQPEQAPEGTAEPGPAGPALENVVEDPVGSLQSTTDSLLSGHSS